jgi:hypothetical protein
MPWLLWSYERQDYRNKELVIVDSSPEPTSLQALGVRVLAAPPGTNIPRKRNLALAAAAGQYVAWFDDDDWQHPERLSRLLGILEGDRGSGKGFAGCSRSWFVDLYDLRARPYDGMGHLIFNTALFRRSAVEGVAFDESRDRASDTVWLRHVAGRAGQPVVLRDPILSWWLSHDRNISNPRERRRFADTLEDVCESVGEEAWGETRERLDALRVTLPAPPAAPERFLRGSSGRSAQLATALARRRGAAAGVPSREARAPASSDATDRSWRVPPVAPGSPAPLEATPEPSLELAPGACPSELAVDVVWAPATAALPEASLRSLAASSGCRVHLVGSEPTSVEGWRALLDSLGEGSGELAEVVVLLAESATFTSTLPCWVETARKHILRGRARFVGCFPRRGREDGLGELACRAQLGPRARYDRAQRLWRDPGVAAHAWVTLRSHLLDWLHECEARASGRQGRDEPPARDELGPPRTVPLAVSRLALEPEAVLLDPRDASSRPLASCPLPREPHSRPGASGDDRRRLAARVRSALGRASDDTSWL